MRTEQIYGLLNYDNANTFCTSDGSAELAVNGTTGKCLYEMYMDGRNSTITINQDGKNYMWPTPTCRPYQMSYKFEAKAFALSSDQSIVIDDVTLWNQDITANTTSTYESGIIPIDGTTEDVANAILNSTRDSKFEVKIHVGTTVSALGIRYIEMYFDYYRYDHEARKANDARGVQSVNVRLAHNQEAVQVADAYHGDLVIYTPNLDPKANWRGWYADPEHTILVSMDVNYTVEATSDLVLYAYATKRQDVDYKLNGEWKEGIVIYEKINGVWTEITKDQIKTDVGYELNRGG